MIMVAREFADRIAASDQAKKGMHMAITLTINGETKSFDAPAEMPLLWVLRDILGMTGTKFGCGIAQCGACTVHVDGKAVRSCVLPISTVANSGAATARAAIP